MFSGPMFTVCLTMALSAVIVPTHGHAAVLAARVTGSMDCQETCGAMRCQYTQVSAECGPPTDS
jgi:hypothetical protein